MADADTKQKRLSAITPMLPFRGSSVWAADTGFKVANRQAAVLLYSGVTVLEYMRGIASPTASDAVSAPKRI